MIDATLQDALNFLDPRDLSYDGWLSVGMALKAAGADASDWDAWSARDAARYNKSQRAECLAKWDTFTGSGLNSGSIIHMAEERGWRREASGRPLDWNDTLQIRVDPATFDEAEKIVIKQPGKGWDPIAEIVRYLETLFFPNDCVGYTFDCYQDDKGKWKPVGGSCDRTRDQLIEKLRKYNEVGPALGDYNHDAGGWVNINPTDGTGRKRENIVAYRYALVESDTTSIEEQIHIMHELKLPVAIVVCSGGKSAHAIVHIDAISDAEYTARVSELFRICSEAGIEVDEANKNPGRLSRLPGLIRGDKKQFIIPYEAETGSWQEWHDAQIVKQMDLPPIQSVADFVGTDTPPLAEELIHGILREGHKMLLTGPSKAGKSFALIELAIAIGTGGEWFGWKCSQGPVLYLNFELDERSCFNRFNVMAEALHISAKDACRNVSVLNLRGYNMALDKLVPYLIGVTRDTHYKAVIFDPLYKVMMGDENSAGDMARFCNYFDMVCREMGCATIYCHHHSKGSQSGKSVMDRGSGSGVFARDPDAIIDMLRLRLPPSLPSFVNGPEGEESPLHIELGMSATAWKISCVLREFETPQDVRLWFSYPLHIVDLENLDGCTAYDEKPSTDEMTESLIAEKQKRKAAAIKSLNALAAAFNDVVPITAVRTAAKLDRYGLDTITTYFQEEIDAAKESGLPTPYVIEGNKKGAESTKIHIL